MRFNRAPFVMVVFVAIVSLLLATWEPATNAVATTRPGYNGKIVYEQSSDGNDSEIFIMDADGSNQTQLTNTTNTNMLPAWSPNGTKIAFISRRDGTHKLYIMNADGSNQTKLSDLTAYVFGGQPQWSPDGTKIFYIVGSSTGYVINADGTNETNIGSAATGRLSPDGTKIAYRSGLSSNYEISVKNIDGTGAVNLTNNAARDTKPLWSPSGDRILFLSERSGSEEMYTMMPDGSNVTKISNHASSQRFYHYSWAPDGNKIAAIIAASDGMTSRLLVVNSDGTDQQLYDFAADGIPLHEGIEWAPDGSKLLLVGNHETVYYTRDVYMLDDDISNLIQLTDDAPTGSSGGSGRNGLDWYSTPNNPPVVGSDFSSVAFNTATSVDVLANDTDEETLNSAYLSVTVQPSHGSATVVDGMVRYSPAVEYQGSDSLAYQICDSFLLDQKCATGVVSLTVQAPLAPSVAVVKVNGENYNPQTNHYITSNHRPTFAGTATPSSEIKVEIHSDPIILTTTADGNGNWSVTPTFDLPSGEHMVYISATLNGLTTELDAFGLSIQPNLANTGENYWLLIFGVSTSMFSGAGLLFARYRKALSK